MFWRFSQRLSGETTKVLECFRTVYKMPENGDIFPRSTLAEPSVLLLRLSLAFFQPGVDPLGEFSWSRLTDCKLLAARS